MCLELSNLCRICSNSLILSMINTVGEWTVTNQILEVRQEAGSSVTFSMGDGGILIRAL